MDVPEQWGDYPCEDYFSSRLATEGYWHDQMWLIESYERIEEEPEYEFLQVGRPGVDSIGFGYRKGKPGFWAFHRMVDLEFQYLAGSIQEFLDGWLANRIAV